MNIIEKINRTKVVTGKVILHHPNIFEPIKFKNSSKAKYSAVIVIPPEEKETIDKINMAVNEAIIQKFGGNISEHERIMSPLKNGNDSDSLDLVYYNNYFVNATNDLPPRVFNKDKLPFLSKITVDDCTYARAVLLFKAYDFNGNKGVSCQLLKVQLFDERYDATKYLSSNEDDFWYISNRSIPITNIL